MPETANTPIMQTRIDRAVKRLSTKVGEKAAANGGILIVTCPKPKSATGTADRVRKEISSGRLSGLPAGYAVKSHGADVVIVPAAAFHPWDRAAIAARAADAKKAAPKNAAVKIPRAGSRARKALAAEIVNPAPRKNRARKPAPAAA